MYSCLAVCTQTVEAVLQYAFLVLHTIAEVGGPLLVAAMTEIMPTAAIALFNCK